MDVQPEGQNRQLGRRDDLHIWYVPQPLLDEANECELLGNVFTKRSDTVHHEREPYTQAAPIPREFRGQSTKIDLSLDIIHRREVLGMCTVGSLERLEVARDKRASAVRQAEPFVRIEGDGVGAVDSS